MPRDLYADEERFDEDLEPEGDIPAGEPPAAVRWLRTMPCWALSAFLHLILIVFFLLMVTEQKTKKDIEAVIVVNVAPLPTAPKRMEYDPKKKRDIKRERAVPGPKNPKVETPIVKRKEVKEEDVAVDVPLGTSFDALTNIQVADPNSSPSKFINTGIGLGGGAAGAYGARWGKGTLKDEGGSDGSEDAVYAALLWLWRHQSEDGSWKSKNYSERCTKTCQNLDSGYGDGRGHEHHDVGVTGLAILAMAGYGHTHQAGEYEEFVDCLKKAVGYLKRVQVHSNDAESNGRYGGTETEDWIYDHAIATMAMGELLIMSGDTIGLKNSVTDAVRLCMRAQNDGRGWRYKFKDGENDTSVTGWMVLALKTAKAANLDIPRADYDRAFAGALNWFDSATAANGKTGYLGPGDPGSMLMTLEKDGVYPYSKDLSCMTAVGVLCRIFSGEPRKSEKVRSGVKILMEHTPRWQERKGRSLSTINIYYWYYGSYALFQYGGKDWKTWNEAMLKTLLENQRQGATSSGESICEDGSWDPIDEWGTAGGRVYSTALGAMTMEVYYRFRRVQTALAEDPELTKN
jgi:hypothetical protein